MTGSLLLALTVLPGAASAAVADTLDTEQDVEGRFFIDRCYLQQQGLTDYRVICCYWIALWYVCNEVVRVI
ncbi:MAG TPA: hypothetical protein VNZ52_04780 [Candidatus Thermoplasmatota archaeon]|nr:hypothetical protein [Candidatus Thermoplasmatota archaeon]